MKSARSRGTDAETLRGMSVEDLEARAEQLREEQFRLRFRAATTQLENPMLVRDIRRDIARINTILHERQHSGEGAR
ncbi:MAG TPA: 50S ribosomal protein L29 [Longimicrobiaceae bacterium]|nr:50S ribosomal protein L29 [Longimicrobiaceae bacterium]